MFKIFIKSSILIFIWSRMLSLLPHCFTCEGFFLGITEYSRLSHCITCFRFVPIFVFYILCRWWDVSLSFSFFVEKALLYRLWIHLECTILNVLTFWESSWSNVTINNLIKWLLITHNSFHSWWGCFLICIIWSSHIGLLVPSVCNSPRTCNNWKSNLPRLQQSFILSKLFSIKHKWASTRINLQNSRTNWLRETKIILWPICMIYISFQNICGSNSLFMNILKVSGCF